MYNILFSFLKPQIAFGGDSGGGGGGGGGGSRADKKGAAAVLSPVYTPPVNATTFNDNNDRPAPVVIPAPVSEPLYGSNIYDVANIYNDDNEDYTPTSAELNAQLADLGATNMTDDYSIVDYSTTSSGNPYIPAAIADSDGGGYMAPIGQNTQSEALIGQATDIGGGVYDPINLLATDAYQLGTGNAIMPPVNPVYDPLDDSNAFTSVNPTNAYDTADIYSEPVVDTYDPLDNDFVDRNPTNAFDVADIYSNDELAKSVYDQPGDEMDFVPRQGPVQAAPPPPGDEMDFVPMQGPSPMPGFFEGDVDSGTFSNTNSIDSNFYDEIPNDFSNFATPGNDSGMEMNLNSPDANFYDDIAFQRDPIDDILAGEQFTTSAANAPASIPVQTADDGYGAVPKVPDQYDLAASESSRFDGYDTAPSVIRDLALGTDTDTVTDTGTAIPTAEEIAPTTGNVSTYTDPSTGQKEEFESYGQVNRFGVYAGDGFEWYENDSVENPNGDPVLSRRYTGKGEGNGLGQEPISATEIGHAGVLDREKFKKIGQISMDEGSEFASSQGSANDGDLLKFLTTGSFDASESFADQYGFDDYDPTLTYGDSEISSSNLSSNQNAIELASKAGITEEILPDSFGNTLDAPKITEAELDKINSQLEATIPNNLFESFISLAANAIPLVGGAIAQSLKNKGPADREKLVQQHINALEGGAQPQYDKEGRYTGFELSSMQTFADEFQQNPDAYMINSGVADANNDGVDDMERFNQVFSAQQAATKSDPYGADTQQGFVKSGGQEYFVTATGNMVPVDDGMVDYNRSGGQSIQQMFGDDSTRQQRDSNECPAGYEYDVAEQMCMPIIDEGADGGSSSPRLTIGRRPPSTQPDPRPPVVRPPSGGTGAAGVNFQKPKFFQDGGSVTPNIDSFLSGLR